MRRWPAVLAALALSACGEAGLSAPTPPAPEPARHAPQRIISLDYCADQYVLRLIDRERIAALSPFATARTRSYHLLSDAGRASP